MSVEEHKKMAQTIRLKMKTEGELSSREACFYLGVSQSTLRRILGKQSNNHAGKWRCDRPKIISNKTRGRLRISVKALKGFLIDRRRALAADREYLEE